MDADIQVLYEDDALLAVAKPSGMATHPAYRHPDGALTDAIFARAAARGEGRPWLLHRLDLVTSAVVLFAKTEAARRALVRQFERHTIRKQYLALVTGTLTPAQGEIDAPLKRDPLDRRRVIVATDGQPSLTRYRVLGVSTLAVGSSTPSAPSSPLPLRLASAPSISLVMAEPVTGRTHQIRAHLAARGAAILGDATYRALAVTQAPEDGADHLPSVARVMLHAWRLTCRYPQSLAPTSPNTPSTPYPPFVVTAPIPADMLALIGQLGLGGALAMLDDVE